MANKKQAVTKTTAATDNIVINNLVIRPVDRTPKDIAHWRNAHRSAESRPLGMRTALYDLYDDCLLDPVLSSLIDKRLMSVTNVKLRFMKDGEDVEALTPVLKCNEFKRALKEALNSRIWGITLLENSFKPYKVYCVPRKHIRPRTGMISTEQMADTNLINYREGMFLNTMVEVGGCDDFGLLLKAIPYVLYKRGCMGDWAQFTEVFGMPTKVGRYDGFDNATRIALENALDKAGSALSIVIPKEAQLEFLESKTTSMSSDLYKALINLCDEQLSILILGQTETTKSSESSGYAQSKTHEKTENEINHDDREFLLSVLEEKFNPIFTAAGYPMEGGVWMFEDDEENISLKDRVVIDTTLKTAGLPIDDDYFYEKYNIPKPAAYDKMIAEKKEVKVPDPVKEKDVKLSANDLALLDKVRDFFA